MTRYSAETYGGKEQEAVDIVGVIEGEVNAAPGYYDGEIESLSAKVSELTHIVAKLAEHLPQAAQDALAADLGYNVKGVL